ncbi:MAG: hypothetical protein ACQETX_07570 [Pseudomonadota bacterium]
MRISIGENPGNATVPAGREGLRVECGNYDSNNKLVLKAGAENWQKNLKDCTLMANHGGEEQEE